MPRPSLASTVRWFQGSVVAPHEARGAERFILPSKRLRPAQRMAIYADAYLARLVEALEEDFPALTRHLGHRRFHRVARAYLRRHPSRHYSLNPLGRKLPQFLSDRPGARDVARVEAAMSEVFDAEAIPPLRPADFAKVPPERLAGSRLAFVPAFRLLELDHAVNPVVDAAREERRQLPPLRRRRSWVAVYRKEFQVWRLDLSEPAFAALRALHRGRTVAQAVAAAAKAWREESHLLQARVRRWFGEWVSEGFFARLYAR